MVRNIKDASILIDDDGNTCFITLGEIGQHVVEQKKKPPEPEPVGVIATVLLGSAAVAAKNVKVSRRFWSK